MLHVTKEIALGDEEVDERFVRAMGGGGQNARREATAVELRLDIGRSSLPGEMKGRLIAVAGRAVTSDGVLMVVSRANRSQSENRETARGRLIALLRRAAAPPKTRTPTGPRRADRENRIAAKKARGAVKRARSRTASERG